MRFCLLLFMIALVESKRKQPKEADRLRHQAPLPPKSDQKPYNIYSNPLAVDFINLGKEGILDPSSGLKHPYDALALDLKISKYPTSPEKLKLLRNAKPSDVIKIRRGKKKTLPPMNSTVSVREYNPDLEEMEPDIEKAVNIKTPMMFDFETVQNLNIASPHIYRSNIAKTEAIFKRRLPPGYNHTVERGMTAQSPKPSDLFVGGSFQVVPDASSSFENWTTCDDFAKNARFHPREVAGVQWVVFYAWAPSSLPTGYDFSFSYPSMKTVKEYRSKYSPYMNQTIDWEQPMLLLKSWTEILLISVDKRGLFYGIANFELPPQTNNASLLISSFTMRMKVVGQYLGIMLCEERIGLILAVAGEEPDVNDREAEAAKLGFNGIGQLIVKNEKAEAYARDRKLLDQKEGQEADEELDDVAPRRYSPFFREDPMFP